MNFKSWGVGFFALLSFTNVQAAQVIADRPGFSTGTHTVAPNRFNLEVGYQADMNGSTTLQTFPISNLRTGLTDMLEFNILWGGYREVDGSHTTEADLSVGLKQRLIDATDYNLSALGVLGLPTGENERFSEVTAIAGLLGDKAIAPAVNLFGVILAQTSYIAGSRELNLQFAIGGSFAHSDKVGSYVEVYSEMPLTHNVDSQTTLNGGLTYLLDPSVQLDFYIGSSVDGANNEFIGFGIAKLF